MSGEPTSPPGSSDRPLPTLTRSRDGSSESLRAESSASGRKYNERSNPQANPDLEPAIPRTPSRHLASRSNGDEAENHGAVRSMKTRSSGGFLLNSNSGPFLSRSKNDTSNVKGKGKREGSGLMISKRRDRHSHRSSIGSSPLATKVLTLEDEAAVLPGTSAQDGSEPGCSVVSEINNANSPTLHDDSQTMGSTSEPMPVGYETDPMQIVNLALSLSEGRRRQASGIRLVSGDSGIRRSVSTSQRINSRVARHESSLGQYLHPETQFSRNISPQAQGHGQTASMKAYNKSSGISGSYLQPSTTDHVGFVLQDDLYDVSDATSTRVQKAKDHFELLYEHRRLLSHLPPLRESAQTLRKSDIEGRAYNPLQYARNRKVRSPETKSIESDAEGWHDVQQVRAWVNAIIEGHTERRADPDGCIRLPELHRSGANEENTKPMEVEPPSLATRKRDTIQNGKPRRPRSDWVISPGGLLADIYWLEQGLNKTKIEDRDGNKIYPWNVELKFTGWRNRTPAHGQGSQQYSHPPETVESSKPEPPASVAPPELPTFTSSGRKGKHRGRGRRREKKAHMDSESESSDSESRKRRKRLRKSLMRPLSRSSTSDSDDEKSSRSPARAENRENEEPAAETRALDHYIRKMLDRDTTLSSRSSGANKPQSSAEPSRSTTKNHGRHELRIRSSRERASSRKRKKPDHLLESVRTSLDKRRRSRPSLDAERPARASLDGETTAPSSPSIHHFPSIAINLSTPTSRSPSPTKKVLHARINPFRDRNQSKHCAGIDAGDLADAPPMQQKSNESGKESSSSFNVSRDTSPMTKNARRTSDTSIPRGESQRGESQRTHSTASKTSSKTPNSPEASSRIRGIFKGGRIAELVGNEVSRVGDFIWKREPPSATRTSSSASSVGSQQGSDTEEEERANGSLLKKPPQPHSGRPPASAEGNGNNTSSGQPQSTLGTGDKPSYFMSNLPSFTSPFQRDREVQEERDRAAFLTPDSSPQNGQGPSDPISMAAAHHRSVSRSSRLGRLAPPKLDISRSNSPAGSPDGRQGSYDFGKNLSGPPVTGLTSLRASKSGAADLTRNWNPSAREVSTERRASTPITKKDIARTRALLLSSGAKARQISLRAHSVRPHPPQFLLDTISSPPPHSPETLNSLRVPRKVEHLLAAHNLISTLTTQTTSFRTTLDHFTSTTSPSLHTSLQALDDLVENTLTPRVRVAADESGELSMKLTTTSTLAVKGLNDVIEGAMRRRRRGPVRWMRRVGYGVVEWLVVGLLWGIWGVVSIFRVAFGIVSGSWRVVRWLVWLN